MLLGYTDKFDTEGFVEISVKGLLNQIYSQQGRFTVKDMKVKKGWLYQMMKEFDREPDWTNYYINDIVRVEFDGRVNDLRIYIEISYASYVSNGSNRSGGVTYMDIPLSEPELVSLVRGKKLDEVVGGDNNGE